MQPNTVSLSSDKAIRYAGGGVSLSSLILGTGLMFMNPVGWFYMLLASGFISAGFTGILEAASEEEYTLSKAGKSVGKSFLVGTITTGLCTGAGELIGVAGKALFGASEKAAQLSSATRVSMAAIKGSTAGVINTATQHVADIIIPEHEAVERSYIKNTVLGAVSGVTFEGVGTFFQKGARNIGHNTDKISGVDGRSKTLFKKATNFFGVDYSEVIKKHNKAKIALKAVDGMLRGGISVAVSTMAENALNRSNGKPLTEDLSKKVLIACTMESIFSGADKYTRIKLKQKIYEEKLKEIKLKHLKEFAFFAGMYSFGAPGLQSVKGIILAEIKAIIKIHKEVKQATNLYTRGIFFKKFIPEKIKYENKFPHKLNPHDPLPQAESEIYKLTFKHITKTFREGLNRNRFQAQGILPHAQDANEYSDNLHTETQNIRELATRLANKEISQSEVIASKLFSDIFETDENIDEIIHGENTTNITIDIDLSLSETKALEKEPDQKFHNEPSPPNSPKFGKT